MSALTVKTNDAYTAPSAVFVKASGAYAAASIFVKYEGSYGTNLVSGFDFFVDSASGNNSNDGLSAAQAKQTLSTITLTPNLKIGLARGSVWKEQIGSAATNVDGVVIGAYGTGQMPVIDCSEVSTGWSKTAGKTNVYEAVLTIASGSTGQFLRLYEDGAPLKWVSSTTLCDAAPGTIYCATATSATTVTVYVHATGSGDPASNGKLYEHTERLFGICAGVSSVGWEISDIRCKRNLHADGSIVAYNNTIMRRCIAQDGGKHSLFIGRDGLAEDCIAYGTEYPERTSATLFVAYSTSGTGAKATFRRCIAICDKAIGEAARIAVKGITGLYAHASGGANPWDEIIYEDCSAIGLPLGFSTLDNTLTTITRCYSESCATGYSPGGLTSVLTDIYNKEASGVTYVAGMEARLAGQTIEIDGFRQYSYTTTSKGWVYSNLAANINLHDSVAVIAGTSYAVGANASISTVNLTMQRCIIQGDSTGALIRKQDTFGIIEDNNYYPSNAQWNNGATSYSSFALWRAAYPAVDVNSLTSDPLLVNPASGDFSLQSGSPAIAIGAGLVRPSISYTPIPSDVAVAAM
ncbi:MAG: hypothetical protein V5B38_04860 [Candidatus Accumulibacter propinquus]|jgi:hypothetical protein